MLHPNADPSEISVLNDRPQGGEQGNPPAKLGRFKRMIAWIDEHWLKPLLVNKSLD